MCNLKHFCVSTFGHVQIRLALLTILWSLVFTFSASAQTGFDDAEEGRPYTFYFNSVTRIIECNILGKTGRHEYIESPYEGLFTVAYNSVNPDSVIIYLWNYTGNNADSAKYNDKYFLMSRTDIRNNALRRYSAHASFTAGTAIVPVKIRFSPFDFSKDITIGPTAGGKVRLGHYSKNYFNFLIGFGITSVSLDSASTKGIIRKSSDRPALTPSIGAVFEMNSAQFGIFIGQDYISSRELTTWRYQGHLWLSIGLGYNILSKSAKENPEKQEQSTKK